MFTEHAATELAWQLPFARTSFGRELNAVLVPRTVFVCWIGSAAATIQC